MSWETQLAFCVSAFLLTNYTTTAFPREFCQPLGRAHALFMDALILCTLPVIGPLAPLPSRLSLRSAFRSSLCLPRSTYLTTLPSCPAKKVRKRNLSRRSVMSIISAPVATMETLPKDFGYVLLTVVGTAALTFWQGVMVSRQRAKSGILYPKMYEDAEPSIFNCYQRAHQNTLESYPAVLGCLIAGGLKFPIVASSFGALWLVGRVVFSLGYYTGEPKNRLRGVWHYFGQFGLMITAAVAAGKLLAN